MKISRRSFLQRLFALVGTGMLFQRLPAIGTAEAIRGDESASPLIARVARPYDAETPVRAFSSFLTPTKSFFVRSHFGPPAQELLTESRWKLRIGGMVDQPRELSLSDLRRMKPVTLTAVIQCSGNGRKFYEPKVPGVQWARGAVGNAEWTGVRLRDLLEQVGVRGDAQHVQFQGADRPMTSGVPLFVRSIPMKKAIHPDTLLAYQMNEGPLPLLHGAPLRVITPGWMAESCIKWLTDITVQAAEAKGYYMQTAYRTPAGPGASVDRDVMLPIEAMVVKSLITSPDNGDVVPQGAVPIQGVAWSGEARISKVDVSVDGGAGWESARLIGDDHPYAWRQWTFDWEPRQEGMFKVLSRATDEQGKVQPVVSPWNPGGFLWNGWDSVIFHVRSRL